MLPVLRVEAALTLPDNDQWQFRFHINSETSDRVYTVAQNKKKRFWACDCPGWKRHRKCKHLVAMNLPVNEQPYEVEFKAA